ncbi:MAG: hypothetical protein O7A04_08025 [Acidobacteria bacterium]|nr:hypothetical protein [Acidobacteriota bacterium]
MSTLAIELHDAGVLIREASASTHHPGSPGFAVLDGARLLTGGEAARLARLKPRHVHSRFWQDLGTSPLGAPFPREWGSADLAYAQLEKVRQAAGADLESVLLAVSGGFSPQQLALLLGIAEAAGLPVTGMIDSAVATAGTGMLPSGRVLHLDLHLHRLVATELEVGDDVIRGKIHLQPDVGLLELAEVWTRAIADAFIRETRFDPLHSAGSEQQLFDRLEGWLVDIRDHDRIEIGLAGSGVEHRAEVRRSALIRAAEPLYATLFDQVRAADGANGATSLALAQRTSALPGLEQMLEEMTGRRVVTLPLDAAARGCLAARESIETDEPGIRLITRLTRAGVPQGPEASDGAT